MWADLLALLVACVVFACYATVIEMYADWWREKHPKKEREP
jgi:hypothetical protein